MIFSAFVKVLLFGNGSAFCKSVAEFYYCKSVLPLYFRFAGRVMQNVVQKFEFVSIFTSFSILLMFCVVNFYVFVVDFLYFFT